MMPAPVGLHRGRTWRAERLARLWRRRKLSAAGPRSPGSPSTPRPDRSAITRPLEAERRIGMALLGYARDLHRWALRCGVRAADAPDVAQIAAISAWRAWESCGLPVEQRAPWLFAIVVRAAWHYRRKALHRIDLRDPLEMDQEPHPGALPGDALEVRESVATLEELAAGTTPERWRIFVAYEIEGVSPVVIAKREIVPIPTFYNSLRLARRDVRAVVRRHRAKLEHDDASAALRRSDDTDNTDDTDDTNATSTSRRRAAR